MYYKFYEKIDGISSFEAPNSLDYDSAKRFWSRWFYKIEKPNDNVNYLYLKHNFRLPVKFENYRDNPYGVFIAVVVTSCVVGLAILIIIIVCVCISMLQKKN